MALFLGCALAGALYLLALVRGRRTRGQSPWRTASFLTGLLLVLVGLWPPLAELGHRDLRWHMGQHLLLGMLGPVGLVLGAPVTLALRALPKPVARRLARVLHARPLRLLTHPFVAAVLNLGGMAALYLTPLYNAMGPHPWLHGVVHFHFLAAGTLFAWAIVGVDKAPGRPSHRTRRVVLFLSAAGHATLSKALYAYGWPKDSLHPLWEVEAAAKLMYYGGDLSELLLACALLARWPWRPALPSAPRIGSAAGHGSQTCVPGTR